MATATIYTFDRWRTNGRNATYSTARSTSYQNAASLITGQQYASSLYYCFRTFLVFDTENAVPSGNIITSVKLRLSLFSDSSSTDFDTQIIEQNFSSASEATYDGCLSPSAYFLWRNTNGIATNTPYTGVEMTPAYVNLSGFTSYSLRSSRDKAANTPSGLEYITFNGYEDADETLRPALIIEYAPPASSLPSIIWWS